MTTLEREIPDFKLMTLRPLVGHIKKDEYTDELYLEKITEFEKKCEQKLIELFPKIDIAGTVKTDRYSLPYKSEITKILYGESYLNGPYEFERVQREIIKQLLNQNVYQLRFYMFINIIDTKRHPFDVFGSVEYKFRYYTKIPQYEK